MESGKVALITGIGGQDGSYLTEFLIKKGYRVRGIIRRASWPNTQRIFHLMKEYEVEDDDNSRFWLRYADLTDASSLRTIIEKFKPDEIYNLGSQSHVGISFQNPISTLDINSIGPLRILDIIRDMKIPCKYYQASSSEMFGISPPPQNEKTPMLPQSPYGIAKLAAYHLTKMYRNSYGIFSSNGILFNHESPRRGINFVTRKITIGIAKMLTGDEARITLGNLDAKRDWGYSKEYVEAMWKILQHHEPEDFVIATGETHTIREFIEECFNLISMPLASNEKQGADEKYFDENWNVRVDIHPKYYRPSEVPALLGDASKAKRLLGWEPKTKFKELAKMMLAADLKDRFERAGILPIEPGVEKPDEFYLEKARELADKLKLKKSN